ncbi:MAG: Wzz/FepE/Etk N-terminal domain-containing protein [Thermoleophilia bacterium]|nr:Wzz/FepE/Etk N-terminal domain-containing protein [Thermoleophilia bacterium]
MESSKPSGSNLDLRKYLGVVWRRKWFVIVIPILVTIITVGSTVYFEAPMYQSSTELLQRRSGLDKALLGSDLFQQSYQPDRDIQTAAELVQSPAVASAVQEDLGDRLNNQDASSYITTSLVKKADILSITATADDPQLAADIANSYANEYIKWRRDVDHDVLQQARAPIEVQIANTPLEQQETSSFLVLRDKLETLKLVEVMQTGDLEVVKPAAASSIPISPKPVRSGIIAFVVSMAAVIVGVLFIDQLDTKIRNADQISDSLGKPILATVPKISTNGKLVTISNPSGICSEAYRQLKTNIGYMEPDSDIKTIMITSPQPGEGKSTTIANLAVTMARSGKKVIIIEADLRRPTLSHYLGLDNSIGITNAISGSCSFREILQVIEAEDLAVALPDLHGSLGAPTMAAGQNGIKPIYCATAGPLPPNPGEMAASEKMGALIAEASDHADIVLIDAPPLGVVGDASGLASKVDGIVLVVRLSQTLKKSLDTMNDFILKMPSNVLGVVVTNSNAGDSDSYGYGGYYAEDSSRND